MKSFGSIIDSHSFQLWSDLKSFSGGCFQEVDNSHPEGNHGVRRIRGKGKRTHSRVTWLGLARWTMGWIDKIDEVNK